MTPHHLTAPETYEQHRNDIARVMDWITLELDRHQTNARARAGDWGYVGELAHARQRLIETLAALSSNEIQTIEDLLSECC